jgi:two-component system sensor histidine kinase KdpD
MLNSDEYEVAEWSFRNNQEAGALTGNLNHVEYTFFPLPGTKLIPGVLAVKPPFQVVGGKHTFWLTYITQISNALEREFLAEMAGKARLLDESGRLYKTLFNSISHEFRIPVATIMGASDSLLNAQHPANVQNVLSNEIFTASVRLNRLIGNLLNMSRLESGKLSVSLDWCDINDLFNKVIDDLKDELEFFAIRASIPENMPLVKIDFGLMEQVLYNLLFNSTQYAKPGTNIELLCDFENHELLITLKDEGPGFSEDELKKLFTKFYRVKGSKAGGLGLGLSIVKGFVEAHSGTVTVENNQPAGAVFTIRIPTEVTDFKNLLIPDDHE